MPTEFCVFLILYVHSIYGILYMYITKYGCVFLKLAETTCIYVAMDLIPILLGSLPLAHNAQHSYYNKNYLCEKSEPPTRTNGARCLYVYMYVCIYVCISLSIQNSILRLAVCILHPTETQSPSHIQNTKDTPTITSLRNYNYVIPRTKWRLERSTAPFQLYGGPTQDGTWP